MTHLVHTREIEAVRKTRRRAKWAARKRRTVTRECDPIFAAIDRCRQADAAFVAASHRFDETGTVEADTAAKKAVAAFAAARLTLARTVPTTPAGKLNPKRPYTNMQNARYNVMHAVVFSVSR
jgi:acyl CoA:acetate/3-ketoacid CoA transferase alpha subunit